MVYWVWVLHVCQLYFPSEKEVLVQGRYPGCAVAELVNSIHHLTKLLLNCPCLELACGCSWPAAKGVLLACFQHSRPSDSELTQTNSCALTHILAHSDTLLHTDTYTHACSHTHTGTQAVTLTHTPSSSDTPSHTDTCTHAHTHACTSMCACVCAFVHVHACVCDCECDCVCLSVSDGVWVSVWSDCREEGLMVAVNGQR